MAFAENLADFFDTSSGFAIVAMLNGVTPVDGIFDNDYLAGETGLDVRNETTTPSFTCPQASVPAAAHGTVLTIGAQTYHVVGVQPDGTGLVRLALELQ